MPITGTQLSSALLSPQMRCYFERKLSPVPPDEIRIRIEETLKFLNIATFFTCNIPVTQEIDDVWHYWILETREYQKLCSMLQGRSFLHHSSNAYLECSGAKAALANIDESVEILGTYVLNYGPFEKDRVHYWTFATQLMDSLSWSLEQLNDWLWEAFRADRIGAELRGDLHGNRIGRRTSAT